MRSMCLLGLLLGASVAAAAQPDHRQRVHAFLAAFNAQDVDALMAQVSADIEWLSVDGAAVAVEARGEAALRRQMTDYFAGCPSCRSESGEMVVTDARLATVEVASWTARDGQQRTQRGLAVYEFAADGRIRRVHYFPAER